jgi:hypothetical protein
MDDLKMLLAVCLFAGCAVGLVFFGIHLGHQTARPSSHLQAAPAENQAVEKSYALLPSQRATITNSSFGDVEVRAEFPVTVIVGECQSSYTVQWHCSTEPHDVTVIDTRHVPIFRTPQANDVKITFRRF